MKTASPLDRRDFMKQTAAAGAGIVIGFYLPLPGLRAEASPAPETPFAPNAFIRIAPDDTVTIIVNHSEMGQGVYTSLPMIAAEELDADWSKVRTEAAPVAPEYNHTMFPMQMTGGSTSVISTFGQLRQAGATARAMLVAAAAQAWKVDPAACRTENGYVVHGSQRLSYGRLAEPASRMSPPKEVKLKDAKDFRLIGKPVKRLDTLEKVNGKGKFGIDVTVPGMLTAVVARPPVFGGKVKGFNAERAKSIAGVRLVIQIASGVAVVADGFWSATRGREALEITWDEGPQPLLDTEAQRERYAELAKQPGAVARKEGDAAAALGNAAKKLEAAYEVPYLAHATMEPLNCVADARADGCEVWTGTQFQTMDRNAAAEVAGLPPEKVKLHTMLLGGGFGRRAVPSCHFVREAVEVSRAVKAPVKVIWTREDDMRGGYYRPMYYHKLAAGLDAANRPLAWKQTIVGQSIFAGTPFASMIKNGIDEASVEGAADLSYSIPNILVDLHSPEDPVPVLWWRSVGHSHNAFVVESFMDELAHAAGKDPYEFRRPLLAKQPRIARTLELAAAKAQWGGPLPPGRGRGIAVHHSFESYVAHVAEVSVGKDGTVRVHRVVCAVDCGPVVNPEIVKAQIESAVIFGLTAALYGAITFEKGRVQQGNFDDYPMLRMNESPEIEVHIVPSTDAQGGIGEPGVPPVAPAVTNAIFAATGKRIRRMPIRSEELRA